MDLEQFYYYRLNNFTIDSAWFMFLMFAKCNLLLEPLQFRTQYFDHAVLDFCGDSPRGCLTVRSTVKPIHLSE